MSKRLSRRDRRELTKRADTLMTDIAGLGDEEDDVPPRVAGCRELLGVLTSLDASPGTRAMVEAELGVTLLDYFGGDRTQDLSEAADLLRDALAVFAAEPAKAFMLIAQTHYNLGCVYLELSDIARELMHLDTAIEHFETAAGMYSLLPDPPREIALAFSNLGWALTRRAFEQRTQPGERPVQLLETAASMLAHQTDAGEDLALALFNLGRTHMVAFTITPSDYQSLRAALEALRVAEQTAQTAFPPAGLRMARFRADLGRVELQVEQELQFAPPGTEWIAEDSHGQGVAGQDFAEAAVRILSLAIAAYEQAADVVPAVRADVYRDLAAGLLMQGAGRPEADVNASDAVNALEEAVRLGGGTRYSLPEIQLDLARAYRERLSGDLAVHAEAGLRHAQDALAAAEAAGNSELSVNALLVMAGLAGDHDEVSGVHTGEAVQYARRAVELARSPGVTPATSQWARAQLADELVNAHSSPGDSGQAAAFSEARALLVQVLDETDARTGPLSFAGRAFNLGRLLGFIGEWPAAEMAFQRSRDAVEILNQRAPSDRLDRQDHTLTALHRSGAYAAARCGDAAAAAVWLEQGNRLGLARWTPAPPPVILRVPDLVESLPDQTAVVLLTTVGAGSVGVILSRGHDGRARFSACLGSLRGADLDRLLVNRSDRGFRRRAVRFSEVRLSAGEGAFLPSQLGLLAESRLERNALDRILREVGTGLVDDLSSVLLETGSQRVVLIPAGALSLIPLHAVPVTGQDRSVVPFADLFDISYAAAITDWGPPPPPGPLATEPEIITDPTGDLPDARMEGVAIVAAYRSSRLIRGSAADRAAAAEALTTRRWVHIAAHSMYDIFDEEQSGIEFADGRLTMDNLKSIGTIACQAVVLSSCQSGLFSLTRNAETRFGLPAALQAKGAECVVAALWPVDDDSSALLAARLYQRLGRGEPLLPALCAAQRWLKQATRDDLARFCRELWTQTPDETLQRAYEDLTLGGEPGDVPYSHPWSWAPLALYHRSCALPATPDGPSLPSS